MTTVWQGLVLGSLYALVAVGYNIVLLSSGIVNFAFAAFVMVGVYVGYTTMVTLTLPWPVGLLIGALLVMALSVTVEKFALRKLIEQHRHLTALMVTIGVSLVIEGLIRAVYGHRPLAVPTVISGDSIRLLGGVVRPSDLLIIGLAVTMALSLHLLSTRTIFGLSALATAEDREAASARGINARGVGTAAFALAGALAGGAGIFVAGSTFADPHLGMSLAMLSIVAVVIGSAGNQLGGLAGGLIAGLSGALAARYFGAEFASLAVFVLLMAILLFKPSGLFGNPVQRAV